MYLAFTENEKNLTLGVEMEIQLLDAQSLRLTPKAPEILKKLQHPRLTKEMFRSTLELVTDVCASVHEVHKDLSETLAAVVKEASQMQIALASTGTHPTADYNNRILSASPRYQELLDRNQWLIKRMAVYGLHVHIGMKNGDECIRMNNFFLQMTPHLIALSASSPFWKSGDTGLDACRPTTYTAHPTSGSPVLVGNWQEFNALYQELLQTGSIQSMKDIWWDLRPSPGYGTLEIRICDAPATLLELESIVAFIHLLAHWYDANGAHFESRYPSAPREWILRENKWRAIRYGMDAQLIRHDQLATQPLKADLELWLEVLEPFSSALGYERYVDCLRDIMAKGNSAQRQRRVYQQTGEIEAVVRHNIAEFAAGAPVW